MTAPIEILAIRRLDGPGVKPFAEVRFGCIVIHDRRVIQQPGQKAWVALREQPECQKADGSNSGWVPVVEITSRSVLDQLRDAVLEAWERGPDRSPYREQPTRGQATWDRSRDHGDEP